MHPDIGAFDGDTVKPTTLWSNHREWLRALQKRVTADDRLRIEELKKPLATQKQDFISACTIMHVSQLDQCVRLTSCGNCET